MTSNGKQSNQPKNKGPLLILSIDGGGIRGLIPAAFLAALEQDLTQSLYDQFDMFAGTSVGSIITMGISGLEYTAQEVLHQFDDKNIQQMFKKKFWGFLWALHGPRYSGVSKRKFLDKMTGGRNFLDIKKPTIITSYDIISNQSVVFKSTGGADSHYNPTMAEVADASTAAPTYFPTVKSSSTPPRWLIDGGIAADNPSMFALATAMHMGYAKEQIKVLSIGTGISVHDVKEPSQYGQASQKWGGLQWLKNGIIDDLFMGGTTDTDYQCIQIIHDRYCRINDELLSASDAMDDISPANINALKRAGQQWYQNHRSDLLAWLKA